MSFLTNASTLAFTILLNIGEVMDGKLEGFVTSYLQKL